LGKAGQILQSFGKESHDEVKDSVA
jgi:hypothetical protein